MADHDKTEPAPETAKLSRRTLLAGSVGAVGGLMVADAAMAQHASHGAGQLMPTNHATMSGSLSSRIYSVNPTHPDMADIAENPENIPPPITRREPAARVDRAGSL